VRLTRNILLCGFVIHLLAGCNDGKKIQSDANSTENAKSSAVAETDQTLPPAAAPVPDSDPRLSDPLRGKVKETMGSGGYTYLLLATERGDVWAAARTFAVAVGDEVEISGLSAMRNFRSPTLGRMFEEIQFAGQARVIGSSATAAPVQAQAPTRGLPAGHPPLGGEAATQQKPIPGSAPKAGDIEKLADGVTVAELFTRKTDLTGKTVRFRGQVVKANRRIMGSNWLHIQDGTGEPGSNDITVTSKTGFAPVGSIVVIEGTLAVDKDFGAGYAYDVIVQDAEVVAE